MRQRQPHRSQLQQSGSLRVEDAASDVDVCNGIAIEQDFASLEVVEEGKQRYGGRQRRDEQQIAVEETLAWRARVGSCRGQVATLLRCHFRCFTSAM